jgi:hypothetical protein
LRSVDHHVMRKWCSDVRDSSSGSFDDLLRLLWRPVLDGEPLSSLSSGGFVPRWPEADPSVPFPMIDAPRDEAFFARSRAAMGWRYLVGAPRWDAICRAGRCVLCSADAGSDWQASVSLSLEHLLLCCPRLAAHRDAVLPAVIAALETSLGEGPAVDPVESARAVFGGTEAASALSSDERCMWVCLVMGWPATVPFMPRYCSPPHDGEDGADGGQSRRLRLSVLSALGPLAGALSAVWSRG